MPRLLKWGNDVSKEFDEVYEFFKRFNSVHRIKIRRLRFFRLASVDRELRACKDGFDALWVHDGEIFRLTKGISKKSAQVLQGMFGKKTDAEEILKVDRELVNLDREKARNFFAKYISKPKSADHLFRILFGYGISLSLLASQRIPYLTRYLPTITRADKADVRDAEYTYEDIENLRHVIENYDLIVENLQADCELSKNFLRDFRELYREKAGLRIIGYGEISTVMKVEKGKYLDESFNRIHINESRWIWKKMPPFPDVESVKAFNQQYIEYRELLVNDIGIAVPVQALSYFPREGFCAVYAGQERMDPDLICSTLIKRLGAKDAETLFLLVLWELLKVFHFNSTDQRIRIGIDGQLSNWVLAPHEKEKVTHNDSLVYIDTSTPLYRVNGKEQLNTELFIKNAPSFLRLFIKIFFLKEVVDRYYDIRSVIIDIIANLYKEKRIDLIDNFIKLANDFMSEKGISDKPITRIEIDKYYKSDAFIWRFFQFSRRVDKFIIEKIFRKKYHYRLPEKIER